MGIFKRNLMKHNYILEKSTDYYIDKLRNAIYSNNSDISNYTLNKRKITDEVSETDFEIKFKAGNHFVRKELLNPTVHGKFISSKTSNKLFIQMYCPFIIPLFLIFFVVCMVFSLIILYKSKNNPALAYYAFPLSLAILAVIYMLLFLLIYFNCKFSKQKLEAILFDD